MNQDEIANLLTKASESVAGLPENLQVKAFELAVNMLSGSIPINAGSPAGGANPLEHRALPQLGDDGPDLVDLLRICKRNPDRYIVFMQELEGKGEPATSASLLQAFKTYKQDVPKLPSRDIDELVAKNMVDRDKSAYPHVFTLKKKARERLTELVALAAAGAK